MNGRSILAGGLTVLQRCLRALEVSVRYRAVVPCEPLLRKWGLYPTLSTSDSGQLVHTMMNLLVYADGEADLLAIAEISGADVMECAEIADRLVGHGLLEQLAERRG